MTIKLATNLSDLSNDIFRLKLV